MLDGGVLGRHAEGVKAHGMEHIEALHGLVAGHDVTDGIVPHMPHMQIAGRIGEHLQRVVFRTRFIHLRLVDLLLFPLLLPLLLNLRG